MTLRPIGTGFGKEYAALKRDGGKMFIGLILLTLGLLLILQIVFKVNLPLFRILAGVTLVYLGLKMMFGTFGLTIDADTERVVTASSVRFTEGEFKPFSEDGKLSEEAYSTAFGEATLNLEDVKLEDLRESDGSLREIEISNAFGETRVQTPSSIPLIVEYSNAFGELEVRGEKVSGFGSGTHKSPSSSNAESALRLKVSSAFGKVKIQ